MNCVNKLKLFVMGEVDVSAPVRAERALMNNPGFIAPGFLAIFFLSVHAVKKKFGQDVR